MEESDQSMQQQNRMHNLKPDMLNEDIINKNDQFIMDNNNIQNDTQDTDLINANINHKNPFQYDKKILSIEQNLSGFHIGTQGGNILSTPENNPETEPQLTNCEFQRTILNSNNNNTNNNINHHHNTIGIQPNTIQYQNIQNNIKNQVDQQIHKKHKSALLSKTSSEPPKLQPKLFEQESNQRNIFMGGQQYPVQYTKMVHENSNNINFEVNQNADINSLKNNNTQQEYDGYNTPFRNQNIEDFQSYNLIQNNTNNSNFIQQNQTQQSTFTQQKSPQQSLQQKQRSQQNTKKAFVIILVQNNVPQSKQIGAKKYSSDYNSNFSANTPPSNNNGVNNQNLNQGFKNSNNNQEQNNINISDNFVKEILVDFIQLRSRKSSMCMNLSLNSIVDANSVDNNPLGNDDISSNNEYEPIPFKKFNPRGNKISIQNIQMEHINSYYEAKITCTVELSATLYQLYVDRSYEHPYKNYDNYSIFHISFHDFELYQKNFIQSKYSNGKFQQNYIKIHTSKNEDSESLNRIGSDKQIQLYRVLKLQDNQIYAIKRIILEEEPQENYLEDDLMFKQIKRMGQFNHPNIVKMNQWWLENEYNSEEEEQQYILYIEMEYMSYQVTSSSLVEYIFNYMNAENMVQGQIKYQAYNIISQILEGLEYIHNKGYYHCDLKPDNILVGKNKDNLIVKIADFDDSIQISKNQPIENHIGTFGYVHKSIGDIYEYKDDLYSLGHILFDLLYFDDKNRLKLHSKLMKGVFPDGFQQEFPVEYFLIEMLVVRKSIKNIESLKQCNLFLQWKQESLSCQNICDEVEQTYNNNISNSNIMENEEDN